MAVSPILQIPLVAPTQSDKTTTLNDMILDVEGAANDQLAVDMSGGNVTLSALQYTRYNVFNCTGLTTTRSLIVPMTIGGNPAKRVFAVRNSSAHNVTVGGVSGSTVTVAPGDGSVVQNDGTDCLAYAAGGPGPAGPTGSAGGGITIAYTFSTTTTNSDPGAGTLRLNNGTQSSATAIFADLLDALGTDWTSVLDTLDASTNAVKGEIRLVKASDLSKWILFDVSARVSHTGYREFTVVNTGSSSASPFSNGDSLMFCFSRVGDGASLSIHNTWTASQSVDPAILVDASTVAVDFNRSNNFKVTLGGNRMLGNPTNMHAGMGGVIAVTQDATGGRLLVFDTYYYSVNGSPVVLSTAPNAIDLLSFYAWDTTHIAVTLLSNFQVIP